MNHASAKPRRRLVPGFTLLEVMMALGIFILGFTMIMAVFPAALLLQKRTIDDVQSRNLGRNVQAVLEGRTIDEADLIASLPATFDTDQQVYPLPSGMLPDDLGAGGPLQEWVLSDRSYPVNIADRLRRRFFWVPLVQDMDATNTAGPGPPYSWRVFVFVLRRGDGVTYTKGAGCANPNDPPAVPGVVRLAVTGHTINMFQFAPNANDTNGDGRADVVRIGDWVLDSNGGIYTVSEAGPSDITVNGLIIPQPGPPTDIWIGRPADGGGPSPAQRIIILTNVVQ